MFNIEHTTSKLSTDLFHLTSLENNAPYYVVAIHESWKSTRLTLTSSSNKANDEILAQADTFSPLTSSWYSSPSLGISVLPCAANGWRQINTQLSPTARGKRWWNDYSFAFSFPIMGTEQMFEWCPISALKDAGQPSGSRGMKLIRVGRPGEVVAMWVQTAKWLSLKTSERLELYGNGFGEHWTSTVVLSCLWLMRERREG